MESSKRDLDLIQRLKEAFGSVAPSKESPYPKEAVPLGTFARATRHDKLGVVTDAFYGEVDEDGQKIIVYTILLFPDSNPFKANPSEQYYVSNEYEYEIIAYLMLPPVNLAALTAQVGGGLFL
jgi:hypothetical protein